MISIGNSLPSFRRPFNSIPAAICCGASTPLWLPCTNSDDGSLGRARYTFIGFGHEDRELAILSRVTSHWFVDRAGLIFQISTSSFTRLSSFLELRGSRITPEAEHAVVTRIPLGTTSRGTLHGSDV